MPIPDKYNTKLQLNENGKIMNLFQPINVDLPDTAWYCNDILCNLNCSYTFPRVLKIIKSLLNSNPNDFSNKIKILIYAHLNIREVISLLYKMPNKQKKVKKIDGAIYNSNISILTGIENQSKLFGNNFDFGNFSFKNEDEIISSYSHSFDSFYKRVLDTPINICMSCYKMYYRKSVIDNNKIQKHPSNEHWDNLIEFVQEFNLPNKYICVYCLKMFRLNCLPPSCITNDLFFPEVPHVISVSNDFERILIQRANYFRSLSK